MTVTLTSVRAWDTTHLYSAAEHWHNVASAWEQAFDAVHAGSFAPGGTEWLGEGAEAAQYQTAANRKRARQSADVLLAAATVARDGASELESAKTRVLDAVADAENDDFVVGDDFSLFDRDDYPPAVAAARQVQAVRHSETITERLYVLTATDKRVAGQMSGHVFAADFPLDVPTPPDPRPPTPEPGDPITDMMIPPAQTGPPPTPFPGQPVIDDVVEKLAQRPPTDPLILEALRQAYEANHQPCNGWQWAGGWLGLGGSTAGLIASIPSLVPPITPVGVAGATASVAGIGGSGAALIDCATR
jgi:hypothetical protein